MPRIPPLPPREWPEEMGAAIAALRPPNPRHPFPVRDDSRPKGLNILGTFAQYPALAQAYHTFNGHVLFASTLSTRQREVLVLRVASRRDCAYEWAQHVVLAGDAGISKEEIDRIAEGPSAVGWSAIDAAMVRSVDELLVDGCIGDETWATLATELDQQQLMDLVFTVGSYDLLATLMKTFELELDDDLAAVFRHESQ